MILYSLVVPIYNDGYLAPAFCAEMERVMSAYVQGKPLAEEFELIFVNDGSKDNSLQVLVELAEQYSFVKLIDLSRNFGQHAAIACGMRSARGDIVLRMNVDMQDPPLEIPRMIDTLVKNNSDLVVGKYKARKSSLTNRMTAKVYYSLFRLLTGFETPQSTSALRAMSRRFVDSYNALTEKSRFPQGLDQWLGFEHSYIDIEHQKRVDNKSAYNFWSRTRLGVSGILYFSDRPLVLMALSGLLVALGGLLLGVWVIAEKYVVGNIVPGYTSLASIGLIAFGTQLGCLGIVGLYIAKIFKEVQNRPLYVVKATYGDVSHNADMPPRRSRATAATSLVAKGKDN
jgi:dolichol-phosphate mannosyltransferase